MTPAQVWPRALAALGWMALIFYLSDQPSVGPELPGWTRVVAHFAEYAILAGLWSWALVPALGRRGLLVAAAIAILYAATDEWHQSHVPGRDSDPLDVAADAAGALAVALVLGARLRARRWGQPDPSPRP